MNVLKMIFQIKMSSNNSTILDKDVIINDLVTSTRLEATQMFLGLKSAVTSDEASKFY